jgi:hypothetical protein
VSVVCGADHADIRGYADGERLTGCLAGRQRSADADAHPDPDADAYAHAHTIANSFGIADAVAALQSRPDRLSHRAGDATTGDADPVAVGLGKSQPVEQRLVHVIAGAVADPGGHADAIPHPVPDASRTLFRGTDAVTFTIRLADARALTVRRALAPRFRRSAAESRSPA